MLHVCCCRRCRQRCERSAQARGRERRGLLRFAKQAAQAARACTSWRLPSVDHCHLWLIAHLQRGSKLAQLGRGTDLVGGVVQSLLALLGVAAGPYPRCLGLGGGGGSHQQSVHCVWHNTVAPE